MSDSVDHPKHYNMHPSGVECITVTEYMNFNIGNAVKYLWRFEGKNGVEDLRKAAWYVNREIERLQASSVKKMPVDEPIFVRSVPSLAGKKV